MILRRAVRNRSAAHVCEAGSSTGIWFYVGYAWRRGRGFLKFARRRIWLTYGVMIYVVSHCIEFDRLVEFFELFVDNLSIRLKHSPNLTVL